MISYIKLLQNIGTFNSDSAAASLELKRLALVYSDNGRGKTTIASVLRSLATNDPLPIMERHRLGSQHPPKVVLGYQDDPSDILFQKGTWNRTFSRIKVFDENFVDQNVYSGLDVDASHRQNLHQLILGNQGVALNDRLKDLVSRNTKHNANLEAKSKAIPEKDRFGLSVDEFCVLSVIPDIDLSIEAAERTLKAAQDQETVLKAPLFEGVEMPKIDVEGFKETLSKGLSSLEKAAEAHVQAHVQSLGEGGESWVSDGMNMGVQDGHRVCPFCGQVLTGLDLIAHYRAYFSDGYTQMKQTVVKAITDLEHEHSDAKQAEFKMAVGTTQQSAQFWARYCDVPPTYLNAEAALQEWSTARDTFAGLLKTKQTALMDHIELSEQAVDVVSVYDARRGEIAAINQTLLVLNETIKQIKEQAETADTAQIAIQLNKLKATKSRYREDIAPLCDDYSAELQAKACTEAERVEARNALEEYRTDVFPQLQGAVNAYLDRFNAGFRVDRLVPANIGGGSGSTCTYNVVINNTPVAIRNNNNPPGEPSFRNTLSAGDRNTLALALFFSSLDQNPDLAETIAVIDDPISSLDDHRSLATVQTVRHLVGQAKQVIVLSHSKRFLCGIWNGANHKECLGLEIAQNGTESTIQSWDVSQDAITEHDQRFFLLLGHASMQSGDRHQVATAIRPHLEGYLRVACPGTFPPGKLLGHFVRECRQKLGNTDEEMDEKTIVELDSILEYANRFHHDTNPAWESEHINPTELLGFVKRTLAFVGPSKSR